MDPSDRENSSKRFITLIVSFHFIVASFFILFLMWYLLYHDTNTSIELFKSSVGVLKDILLYDFGIITIGLGFITAEQFTRMMVEKFKAMAPGNVYGGYGMNNYNVDDTDTLTEGVVNKIENDT